MKNKIKYILISKWSNGNEFHHGPFNTRLAAAKCAATSKDFWNATSVKVRAVFSVHPNNYDWDDQSAPSRLNCYPDLPKEKTERRPPWEPTLKNVI